MKNMCCICGNDSQYVIYPKECIKKDGSKSMFGISEDSVKYFCSKCYKDRYGSAYINKNGLIKWNKKYR